MEISWNRRAYNIGLFYNFDNKKEVLVLIFIPLILMVWEKI